MPLYDCTIYLKAKKNINIQSATVFNDLCTGTWIGMKTLAKEVLDPAIKDVGVHFCDAYERLPDGTLKHHEHLSFAESAANGACLTYQVPIELQGQAPLQVLAPDEYKARTIAMEWAGKFEGKGWNPVACTVESAKSIQH